MVATADADAYLGYALLGSLASPQSAAQAPSDDCTQGLKGGWAQALSCSAIEIHVSALSPCSSSSSFQSCQSWQTAVDEAQEAPAPASAHVLFQSFGWDSCRQHQQEKGCSFYQHMQAKVPELQVRDSSSGIVSGLLTS